MRTCSTNQPAGVALEVEGIVRVDRFESTECVRVCFDARRSLRVGLSQAVLLQIKIGNAFDMVFVHFLSHVIAP
jgi:hypothetical protein